MATLPKPELAFAANDFLLLYIHKKPAKKPKTIKQISNALKNYAISLEKIEQSLKQLETEEQLKLQKNRPVLNDAGEKRVRQLLGKDVSQDWETLCKYRLPMQALGYDADDSNVRQRFKGAEGLRHALLAQAFKLDNDDRISLDGIRSTIVWRQLAPALPAGIKPPYPLLGSKSVIGHTVLAGLAGVTANGWRQAVERLAATLLNLPGTGIEPLRQAILKQALQQSVPEFATNSKSGCEEQTFAARVLDVAQKLETPRFNGQVAIGQVYDAYGRHYADAGSLASFKQRILEAAKAGELQLTRANQPGDVPDPERSIIHWDDDIVHLIVVEWR
ncbi:hypothetical protein [Rhabdochromatium marinum]|uniref:hypothetical protein n=1 Tax=Rhabdochromatium marinum TaxID=48729 RepID=UPI001907CC5B|nr:hypothetical protein [Rhabdochromatium marinum]MBK1649431.1 hypothetical protein [Rhabdochromatium marinum]